MVIRTPTTVFELFVTRALVSADAPFLFDVDGSALTYRQAMTRAADLVRRLRRAGAGSISRGSPIGLYLPNSWTWPVACVAAWSTGASVACVGTQLTTPESAARFARAGVRTVVLEPNNSAANLLRAAGFRTVSFDARTAIPENGVTLPSTGVGLQREAAVMFSSGTTGLPKIVSKSHTNLVTEYGANMALRYTGQGGFRTRFADANSPPGTSFNPFGHVAAFARLIYRMWIGEALVLVDRFSVDAVKRVARRWPIDTLQLTPAMLHALSTGRPIELPSLRYVTCGTAPLSDDVRAHFEERFGVPVLQTYGSTEFGVLAHEQLDDVRHGRRPRNAVGRPIDGVDIRVVNTMGQPATSGESGAVIVRFSERRIETLDLAGTRAGEWLATGDRGRIDLSGILSIDGRVDDVIIVGGFNVDPREVEDALRKLPQIVDAAVCAVPEPRLGHVVGAVIVSVDDGLDVGELERQLRTYLAHYKVPRRWVVTTELPLVGPGKPDNKRVQELLLSNSQRPNDDH